MNFIPYRVEDLLGDDAGVHLEVLTHNDVVHKGEGAGRLVILEGRDDVCDHAQFVDVDQATGHPCRVLFLDDGKVAQVHAF